MTIKIYTPMLPESVNDASVATWHKKVGDFVKEGETLVDLETDKIMLEVPATASGVLTKIVESQGAVVHSEALLAEIDARAGTSSTKEAAPQPATVASVPAHDELALSPTVRALIHEHQLDPTKIAGTGKHGRLTKQDIENDLQSRTPSAKSPEAVRADAPVVVGLRQEERVPMTRLRSRIAERLLTVKQSTAMLTTFNEVNMQPVMDLRAKYKDGFEKAHHVRLGFMSFFIKAATAALQAYPVINATLDGDDVVYHHYVDIGIAVASQRGLVVPIIRHAEQHSMAGLEKQINDFAVKAKDGKLTMEDLTGGTFTITNGGVFGSMLSTPILNPPQSAILGMHNIVKRPVVENDEIVIRPVMYLALSYDHRLIDGAEAVRFLVMVKERLEDPARLLLEV